MPVLARFMLEQTEDGVVNSVLNELFGVDVLAQRHVCVVSRRRKGEVLGMVCGG